MLQSFATNLALCFCIVPLGLNLLVVVMKVEKAYLKLLPLLEFLLDIVALELKCYF